MPELRAAVLARRAGLVLLIAGAAIAVATLPPGADTAPRAMTALAIVVFTVGLWATGAVPHHVAALVFFALALGSQVAPPLPILKVLASSGVALAFGGLLIGTAADRSGLGRVVARRLVERFGGSYRRLTLGILVGNVALGFLIPASMGRMAITIPLVAAAAREAGHAPGSRPYVGLMLTVVVGGFVTSFGVLPANLMNVLTVGAAETALGLHISYGRYLVTCFPVLAAAKLVLYWLLSVALFEPSAAGRAVPVKPPVPEPLSPAGRRLALVLTATIALWATDFLHGIAPGWIALAAGLACALPGMRLIRPSELMDGPKLKALIVLGGVLGLAALLTESGAGQVVSRLLTDGLVLPRDQPATAFAAVALAAMAIAVLATIVGALSIITPALGELGARLGLAPEAAVLSELTGLTLIVFPYQAVPVMVGLALSGVRYSQALRITIPVALASVVIILPLNILWLRVLGLFG